MSAQLESAFPPGIETLGEVEDVLRRFAWVILELHKNPEYLGFLRMVAAGSRRFPWIAQEFAAVMDPQTERLTRYLAHLSEIGVLECRNPLLAAHQFMGTLNELSLWPWMMGRKSLRIPVDDVIGATVTIWLRTYRCAKTKKRGEKGTE